jgi:hypothetical protein
VDVRLVTKRGNAVPIKKSVLMFEVLKLGLFIVLVSGIFTGRINPILAGKVLGIAGLLYGTYFFYRALFQREHGNLLLRLRGDDRRIPPVFDIPDTGQRLDSQGLPPIPVQSPWKNKYGKGKFHGSHLPRSGSLPRAQVLARSYGV